MTTIEIPAGRAPTIRGGLRAAGGAAVALFLGLTFGLVAAAVVATTFFGFDVLTVRSSSMAPAIGTGDVVVVRPQSMSEIQPGDVILFRSGGDRIPTVHRVAGINEVELRVDNGPGRTPTVRTERRLVTKGDANKLPDQAEVGAGDLLGEVWFSLPAGLGFSGLPLGMALFVFGLTVMAAWGAWEWRHWQGGRR